MAGSPVPYTGLAGEAPAAGTILPDAYDRIQATPADFGGQIGQAESGALDQGVQQIGVAAGQIQALHDKTTADAATNQNMVNGRNLLYGDPNDPNSKGFFSLQGADALHANAATAQQLETQRAAISATLSPNAALLFDQDSRRYNVMLQDQIGQHTIQQNQVYQRQTAASGIQLRLDDASRNYQNPAVYRTSVDAAKTLQANLDQQQGASPDTIAANGVKIEGEATKDLVLQMANGGKPAMAQDLLDQAHDQGQIDPVSYDNLSRSLVPKLQHANVNNAAGGQLSTIDSNYQQSLTAAPAAGSPALTVTPAQISAAIGGQESGNDPNAPTSVDGAVGQYQITPGTFAQYAKPGESITSNADQKTVHDRIIADLSSRYPNDPQRVAVAYFSGPGNVAPAGSATPYIDDKQDGNGQSTSGYVGGFMGRLGAAGGVAGVQSKADYYRAHFDEAVSQTHDDYLSAHPNDEQGAELASSRVAQQMHATISAQAENYKADNDTVIQAANGNLSTGQHPMTVNQLIGTSPAVSAAWDRLQTQQPAAAHEIATRLLTENAKGSTGDTRTLGAGFSDVFQRIHAHDGDPNKITDQTQLYGMVGQPGGLTMDGLAKARSEIAGRGTPDGEADSRMRAAFFKNGHDTLTGTNDQFGLRDPEGEAINLRWMARAYTDIDAATKAGKTPMQIFNPASPDYVGKTLADGAGFKRSLAQRTADMDASNSAGAGTPSPVNQPGLLDRLFGSNAAAPKIDLSTPESIRSAWQDGQISRADAIKAMVGKTAAPPPAPVGGLPMAQ
ncbi:hypothetical protein MMC19_007783, partial [Ptychographa xylographoides]|nr:hypothetical protein [Ptychographa xylographoides]